MGYTFYVGPELEFFYFKTVKAHLTSWIVADILT